MTTYLRPKHAAKHLDIGLSTLWKWAKDNPDFPEYIKLGPRVTVFRKEDLDAFAQAAARNGGAQ